MSTAAYLLLFQMPVFLTGRDTLCVLCLHLSDKGIAEHLLPGILLKALTWKSEGPDRSSALYTSQFLEDHQSY